VFQPRSTVTGGIHEALDRARDAANGMDVRIGGGPDTIQQYLRTGLIHELHVAISPVLLGGESDYSRGLTCALWETNAFGPLRRRKLPMCHSGAKGTVTPNNRLQQTAPLPPLSRKVERPLFLGRDNPLWLGTASSRDRKAVFDVALPASAETKVGIAPRLRSFERLRYHLAERLQGGRDREHDHRRPPAGTAALLKLTSLR
jgi:hypothetical protein